MTYLPVSTVVPFNETASAQSFRANGLLSLDNLRFENYSFHISTKPLSNF